MMIVIENRLTPSSVFWFQYSTSATQTPLQLAGSMIMLNRIAGSTACISLLKRRGVEACVGATKSISCRRGATQGFQFDLNYGYTMKRLVAPKRWLSDGPQSTEKIKAVKQTWLQRFLGPKPMPTRYSFHWYREIFLICTIFAITGTSTMLLVSLFASPSIHCCGQLETDVGSWHSIG